MASRITVVKFGLEVQGMEACATHSLIGLPTSLALVETASTAVVGTLDAHGMPELTRAWGAQVLGAGQMMELCIEGDRCGCSLANLQHTRRVTACFESAGGSIQVRGQCLDISGPRCA